MSLFLQRLARHREDVAKSEVVEKSNAIHGADGKFASHEGSGAAGAVASKEPHGLVTDLWEKHKTAKAIGEALQGVDKAKLHTALTLIATATDAKSKSVKKLIEAELDDRAGRGL
jgi:hypothetical protein